GHDSPVTTLVVSSDGRWVATASEDSTIILWDAREGCIAQEWFTRHCEVWDLAFSPDSRHLASAGGDGKVAIWDISGSSREVACLDGHPSSVKDCAWSGDGAYLASRDSDDIVRLWDGQSFQPLPLLPEMASIKPLFSPDSRWLLVLRGGSCGVWDLVSDACLALEMPPGDEDISPVLAAFSPSSTHVAVGCLSGMTRIWDVATRQECLRLKVHEGWVYDMVFSPDCRLLLIALDNYAMKVWDVHTGAMVHSLDGHSEVVSQACFSPCRKYIASASADETVRVWRTSDGPCLATLSDHSNWVSHVAFTPDGTMLWSAAFDGTV
ncbi:WD40 repeat-like protein, partial [Dichomitus squalens LYAD-421 SS1]